MLGDVGAAILFPKSVFLVFLRERSRRWGEATRNACTAREFMYEEERRAGMRCSRGKEGRKEGRKLIPLKTKNDKKAEHRPQKNRKERTILIKWNMCVCF